jgi:hypothetical protein
VLHATWAVGYLVVAAAWWPAAVIAVGVWTWRRADLRHAGRVHRMNKAALARRLELLQEEESFNSAAGHRITDVLRKAT